MACVAPLPTDREATEPHEAPLRYILSSPSAPPGKIPRLPSSGDEPAERFRSSLNPLSIRHLFRCSQTGRVTKYFRQAGRLDGREIHLVATGGGTLHDKGFPLTRAILACVSARFAQLNGQTKCRDAIMDADRLYRRYEERLLVRSALSAIQTPAVNPWRVRVKSLRGAPAICSGPTSRKLAGPRTP